MATTYNPEISNIVKREGGSVIYSSGNILVVSEVSQELYIELLKNPHIDSLEVLPLKKYSVNQTTIKPTAEIDNHIVAFDDIESDDSGDDSGNVPGGGR